MAKNSFIGGNQGNRACFDFYPTPPYAVEELLKRENFNGNIWECACGDGAVSEVLKKSGFDVISSDIVNRGYGEYRNLDFLDNEATQGMTCDNIITNPPFKLAKQFVEKSLSVAKRKVAIIQRLAFMESKERYDMFTTTPLKTVYVFSKRLNMYANGLVDKTKSGMLAFAWYVWDKDYTGKPYIKWILKED